MCACVCLWVVCVCVCTHRSGECVVCLWVCECVRNVCGESFVGLQCPTVGPQLRRCGPLTPPHTPPHSHQCVFVCLGVGVAPPTSLELVTGGHSLSQEVGSSSGPLISGWLGDLLGCGGGRPGLCLLACWPGRVCLLPPACPARCVAPRAQRLLAAWAGASAWAAVILASTGKPTALPPQQASGGLGVEPQVPPGSLGGDGASVSGPFPPAFPPPVAGTGPQAGYLPPGFWEERLGDWPGLGTHTQPHGFTQPRTGSHGYTHTATQAHTQPHTGSHGHTHHTQSHTQLHPYTVTCSQHTTHSTDSLLTSVAPSQA